MMTNAASGAGLTIDNAADYVLVYDNSATAAKKVMVGALPFSSVGLVLALGG